MNKKLIALYLNYLGSVSTYTENQLTEIRYSFLTIISEVEKIALLGIIFIGLGKFADFLICTLILIAIRVFAGGLHFKGFWQCFLFSLAFFLLTIVILPLIPLSDIAYLVIALGGIAINFVFSPVLSLNRPTKDKKKRRRYKWVSTIFAGLPLILFILQARTIQEKRIN